MSTLSPLHGLYRRVARRLLVCAIMPAFAVPCFASQSLPPSLAPNCVDREIGRGGFSVSGIPATPTRSIGIAPAPAPGTRVPTIARVDSSLRAHGERVAAALHSRLAD